MHRKWIILLALLVFVTGCATDGRIEDAESAVKVARGGAQLWAENCRRCHALRPPSAFSDNEWEVIVNHMRTRAHLTGEESRKITEFLKAAN